MSYLKPTADRTVYPLVLSIKPCAARLSVFVCSPAGPLQMHLTRIRLVVMDRARSGKMLLPQLGCLTQQRKEIKVPS